MPCLEVLLASCGFVEFLYFDSACILCQQLFFLVFSFSQANIANSAWVLQQDGWGLTDGGGVASLKQYIIS